MTPHYHLWVELYPSQNSYVEILITEPQSVTAFGDGSFKEVIHLKMKEVIHLKMRPLWWDLINLPGVLLRR